MPLDPQLTPIAPSHQRRLLCIALRLCACGYPLATNNRALGKAADRHQSNTLLRLYYLGLISVMPHNMISPFNRQQESHVRTASIIILYTCISLLAGCASSERVYGNIYEGLKTRETIVHPSVEPGPPEKSMSYQEYEAERKKLLESDNKQ